MNMVLKVSAAILISLGLVASAFASSSSYNCYASKFDKVQNNKFAGGKTVLNTDVWNDSTITLEFQTSSRKKTLNYNSVFVLLGIVTEGPFKGKYEGRVRNGEDRAIETIYLDQALIKELIGSSDKAVGSFMFVNAKGEVDSNVCYRQVIRSPDTGFDITRASVGDEGVGLITFEKLPSTVRSTFSDIDMGFELGDGYYDVQANAYYEVYNQATGKLEGYMEVGLASYTEDPEYVVAAAYVSVNGARIADRNGDVLTEKDRFSISDKESLASLPPELQPSPEE